MEYSLNRVIADLKGRKRNGLVDLPPPLGLRPGDRVKVRAGPFANHFELYAGQAPHERVAVLLVWLGGQRRMELPAADVVAVPLS